MPPACITRRWARLPVPALAGLAATADARFREHNRGCNNMSTQNRMNHSDPGAPADRLAAKKPYQKPAFRHERVFETRALVCGKVQGTQGACASNRKTS